MGDRWTWAASLHPHIAAAIAQPAKNLEWCDRLEGAADAVVGKLLCVFAARAVARVVLSEVNVTPAANEAIDLLDRWIDDPTDERFDRICSLIFGDSPPEFDAHGVVWWSLRTATSSVGNFEAASALASTCRAAEGAGFRPEQLRSVAERELAARSVG